MSPRGRPRSALWLLLALTGSASLVAVEPDCRMAITFDDLPAQRAHRLSDLQLADLTERLVTTLVDEKVPAVGFVNEQKLEVDGQVAPSRVALLERWLDGGLELGNHTYSHPDLHRIPLAEFQEDLLRGEVVSRPLAAAHSRPYRYFRHPFLHTGLDMETKRGLETFLGQHDYVVAPVTVDNSEWIYAAAYDSADTYVGQGGITWLHRWAITRRLDRSIFRGEPLTTDWIQELAGIRE